MKKYFYIVLLTLISVSFVQAQEFPSQVWHEGRLFLIDGEILEGPIKYDLETNTVQRKGNTIETFNATSLEYFEIYDEYYGGIRTFYSLPYAMNPDYEVPVFFELLVDGNNLTLLCREFITVDNRMGGMGMGGMYMNPMWGGPMMGVNKLAFNFYFLQEGKIQKYSQKRKELLNIMDDKSSEVKLFIRKNRLNHDRRGDLLRITSYYNKLKES
ncbi:hypothetical protein [Litoribacter populi]|uniref:hypothetical protein n=1 Tax=Litoribacter populi TaxID=2598460 RepID=UPI00118053AC|nr:hypothetical protein [Litoribacter populi]